MTMMEMIHLDEKRMGFFYISNDRVMTQDHHSMKKVVVEEIYLEQDHFLSKQI